MPIAGLVMAKLFMDQGKTNKDIQKTEAYKLLKAGKVNDIYKLEYSKMISALKDIITMGGVGLSVGELYSKVDDFIDDGLVEKFSLPYRNAAYKPVVQMVDYLRFHGYRVYASTGSPVHIVQAFSEEVVHIPAHHIIGTRLKTRWDEARKDVVIERGLFPPLNDKAYKPVNIANYIPERPIITFGNSNGDMQMFEYTKHRKGPSLAVLIHHNDSKRDVSYTAHTEKALEDATKNGWVVAKSKQDFKQVFMVPSSKLTH